jgi:hypothetical protein
MNSTGRKNEKTAYLVILLLVVGLTAFSNSMKELAQIQELTVDASRLVAQWSNNIAPVEIPQIPEPPQVSQVVVPIESCQSKKSAKVEKIERRVVRLGPTEDQLAKLKKLRRFEFGITTRDREILLKTLNRSINLRIAS